MGAWVGFESFWSLLNSNTDVKTDPQVLSLNLTDEALERFAAGMQEFRTSFKRALSKEKIDMSPRKHHLTETR